jgi:hypothetical protein
MAKYNFCTLFDTYYLTRGLALYYSLEKVEPDFHLFIFAFNNQSYDILKALSLPKATIISLQEFEDTELLRVKPTRTIAEYCWTSTPSTILYVIEKYGVESCTYLDADLYFYQSPKILLNEMNGKAILLTEHRYPKQYNRTTLSGKYCVQFMTFYNNTQGLKALKWWRERCLEWCYDRYEDGKFGDQKYLDDWTERFEGVHVLQHLGGGMAAWNVESYRFIKRDHNIIQFVDKESGNTFECVFYHFHHVRFFKNNITDLGWRRIAPQVVDYVYSPYIAELFEIEEKIKKQFPDFNIPLKPFKLESDSLVKSIAKTILKKVFKLSVYNTTDLINNGKLFLQRSSAKVN